VFLLPYENGSKKDTANLSLFLNTKAMQSSVNISLCGLKIAKIPMKFTCVAILIASVFDLTVLRLLPWSRSEFTDKVSGYPNIFTVRCGMYGTLIATLFQSSASITNVTSFKTTSVIAFLVISMINLMISFLLVVMFIQIAFSGTLKVNIIHYYKKENGDFEVQLRAINISEKDNIDKNDKCIPNDIELGPMRVSAAAIAIEENSDDLVDTVVSPMADAEFTIDIQTINTTTVEPVIKPFTFETTTSPKIENENENEVIKDERGILFNATSKYADETLKILRDQITKKGFSYC
jgi:hypothetical protein